MPSSPRRHGPVDPPTAVPGNPTSPIVRTAATATAASAARARTQRHAQPPPQADVEATARRQRRGPAAAAPGGRARRTPGRSLNIAVLKDMGIQALTQVGKDLNVEGATGCASRI
jgi:hypothetical protein